MRVSCHFEESRRQTGERTGERSHGDDRCCRFDARPSEGTAPVSEFEDDDVEREADDFRAETDDMSSRTDNVSYRQLTCATDGTTLGRRREGEVANGRREIPE